jgi:hypothetical protein
MRAAEPRSTGSGLNCGLEFFSKVPSGAAEKRVRARATDRCRRFSIDAEDLAHGLFTGVFCFPTGKTNPGPEEIYVFALKVFPGAPLSISQAEGD